MYLEEIKCKKNGKVYTTRLIRESFRENGKVKHRTLCNVSKLPKKQLLDLKKSLSGSPSDFSVADLSIGQTYEYGASFALKSLATQIGLDKAIFSTKTQWREDAMAMICGRIIHQGSKESDFKIITALTHGELKKLIEKEKLQMELFDQSNITEIVDSENGEIRYMLCENDFGMKKETQTRQKMIEKVSDLFATQAAVKRKRDPQKVCASIGRIFEKCKIEKFFSWNVGENGELTWELKHDIIEQEQKLDGCYVIKTDAQKDVLSKETTVETYRNLQKVEQSFKNMKTVMLELRPIYHKSDERIKSHIFIVMLSYYLQWHAMQKLKPMFEKDSLGADKRWTFSGVINRLKSISKVESTVNGVPIKTSVSKPDSEQQQILNLLGVQI